MMFVPAGRSSVVAFRQRRRESPGQSNSLGVGDDFALSLLSIRTSAPTSSTARFRPLNSPTLVGTYSPGWAILVELTSLVTTVLTSLALRPHHPACGEGPWHGFSWSAGTMGDYEAFHPQKDMRKW